MRTIIAILGFGMVFFLYSTIKLASDNGVLVRENDNLKQQNQGLINNLEWKVGPDSSGKIRIFNNQTK